MGRTGSALVIVLGVLGLASVARAQSQVVTFDDAVGRALARNPNARIAMEEITRAHALVEQTRAASRPTLTGNLSYSRIDGGPAAGGTANVDGNLGAASLSLGLPLVAPRAWAQLAHARHNVEVSRLSAAEVKRELAATTARTYLAIVAQRHVLEVAQRARQTAQAHSDYAHQRLGGGYGTRVDEVRAAEEVATDAARVENAEAQLTRLRETLGVLLGADQPLDATSEVVLPAPTPSSDAPRDALTLREDLRLARGRLDLATRIRRDSWTEYLPTVSANLQPYWQSQPTLLLPGSGWQATVGLSWSIYDGGLRYGLIKERRSLEAEARLGLENAERQAGADVRAADDEVKRSTAALKWARDAAKLADEALALTNLGYRAGASTNIEVIDAERRARDAETAVAEAEDAWRQALLDLLLASGHFPGRS
jgi:outer membrane protein TolC